MQRKALHYLTANGVVLTILSMVFGVLISYGSCIEPYIVGYVVEIPKPARIWRGYVVKWESHREVEEACFDFVGLHKLAPAIPVKYAFDVEARFSEKINVSAFIADKEHQSSSDPFSAHPAGETWNRGYCFEMPGTIADDQKLTVTGHAEHKRLIFGQPFPFWRSITPVPTFVVLKTRCYRDDGSIKSDDLDCKET